jgi:arylsulfatase
VIQVDGTEYARLELQQTVALAFTASETFDVGTVLGSPVSRLYYDRRPFPFTGTIRNVNVRMQEPQR